MSEAVLCIVIIIKVFIVLYMGILYYYVNGLILTLN